MSNINESLELLNKFFAETQKNEIDAIISKINALDFKGNPTVKDYFSYIEKEYDIFKRQSYLEHDFIYPNSIQKSSNYNFIIHSDIKQQNVLIGETYVSFLEQFNELPFVEGNNYYKDAA